MILTNFLPGITSEKTPLLPTKPFFSLLPSLTYVSISLLLLNLHGFVLVAHYFCHLFIIKFKWLCLSCPLLSSSYTHTSIGLFIFHPWLCIYIV